MNVTTKTTALIRADFGHRLSLQPPEHRAYPSQPRGLAGSAVALIGEEYVRLLHPEGRKGSATIAQKIPVYSRGTWLGSACRLIADLPQEAASLAGVLQARPAARGAPPGYSYIKPGELVAPFAKWRRIGNPFAPNPTEIPATTPGGKNAAAVALGSLGGRAGGHKGGRARAANLTPEELSAIGRKGAAAKRAKAEERRLQNLADARDGSRIPDEDFSPDYGLIVLNRLVTGDDP